MVSLTAEQYDVLRHVGKGLTYMGIEGGKNPYSVLWWWHHRRHWRPVAVYYADVAVAAEQGRGWAQDGIVLKRVDGGFIALESFEGPRNELGSPGRDGGQDAIDNFLAEMYGVTAAGPLMRRTSCDPDTREELITTACLLGLASSHDEERTEVLVQGLESSPGSIKVPLVGKSTAPPTTSEILIDGRRDRCDSGVV